MMNARVNAFCVFKDVANNLYEKIDKVKPVKTFDEINAFTVNSSLACELGLKAIIAEKYKYPKTHDLSKLFDMLSDWIREYIKNKMPTLIDKGPESPEFKEYIDKVSDNFIEWRYYYENDIETNWLFLHEFMNAIGSYFKEY